MSAQAEQRLRSGVLRDVAAALDARAELHANGVAAPVLSAIGDADQAATAASRRSAWAEGLGQAVTVLACGAAALASAVLAGPQVLAGSVDAATAAVVVLLQLALVEPYAAMTTAVRQYPALRLVLDRISEAGVLDAAGGPNALAQPTPMPCAPVPWTPGDWSPWRNVRMRGPGSNLRRCPLPGPAGRWSSPGSPRPRNPAAGWP